MDLVFTKATLIELQRDLIIFFVNRGHLGLCKNDKVWNSSSFVFFMMAIFWA